MVSQILLEKLIDVLLRELSLDDLQDICFDLGIDYEHLMGTSKGPKSRSLVELLYRQNRIPDLVDSGRRLRPYIDWPDVGSPVVKPSTSSKPGYSSTDLLAIRDVLLSEFNREELETLYFMIGVDYDSIAGGTKSANARELITYMHRRGELDLLVTQIRQLRPQVSFPFDVEALVEIPTIPSNQLPIETLEVVAEAKLILVGHGNVGKTSLVNRLVNNSFNVAEQTTRGVAITKWYIDIPHPDVKKARLNIWDFGGQGSMHATHPYFFSRRAIYILVLNMREDDRKNRAEYWLRLISAFGGNSPIVIVSNKIDQFHTLIDELSLKNKYPNIVDFVRTSAATGQGMDELQKSIANTVANFEDVGARTPTSFIRLKHALENMTDLGSPSSRDTVTLDEFDKLCDRFEVDPGQRLGFLRRLNDLGVMLYFDDARLDLNVVLNPMWVTEGVYRIINCEPLAETGGRLKTEQIRTILPKDRYPSDKAMYILDMMRKFELCFPLDDKESLFILPDLLPPLQPELPYPFNFDGALKFQYEYPVWQGSFLTRLLVRLNHYLFDDVYWRNGALLRSLDGNNNALVIADEADRRLRIWIDGTPNSRRSLLNRIREELNVIHANLRAQIKEWVITPQGGEVPYLLLVNLEAKGTKIYDVLLDDKLIELNVEELLNGVRGEKIPESVRLKELIVQHLSMDELDELCFRFKISLDDLEGEIKNAKARNLIRYFERRQHMPELMAVLRDLRRDVTWV